MNIITTKVFDSELNSIFEYISKDSIKRAKKFEENLFLILSELTTMSYKYKQSEYHNSKEVRQLTFKGYSIIYLIKSKNIILLHIFKYINF
mgnify:CR=1 FL=1